eukprot:1370604-Amorphochlora_amoeboformis.AAC.1
MPNRDTPDCHIDKLGERTRTSLRFVTYHTAIHVVFLQNRLPDLSDLWDTHWLRTASGYMIKLKGSIELQVVCFLAFSGSCFGAGGTSVKSLEASVAEDSSQEKDRAHDNATARMVHNDSCIDCVFSLGVETGSVKKYPGRHFFERFYDSDDMTKPRKKDFAEIIP